MIMKIGIDALKIPLYYLKLMSNVQHSNLSMDTKKVKSLASRWFIYNFQMLILLIAHTNSENQAAYSNLPGSQLNQIDVVC